jgi:hypothetical protein
MAMVEDDTVPRLKPWIAHGIATSRTSAAISDISKASSPRGSILLLRNRHGTAVDQWSHPEHRRQCPPAQHHGKETCRTGCSSRGRFQEMGWSAPSQHQYASAPSLSNEGCSRKQGTPSLVGIPYKHGEARKGSVANHPPTRQLLCRPL